MLAEVGRQPWVVYGVMKTSDAVSPISTSQVFDLADGFCPGLLSAGSSRFLSHGHACPQGSGTAPAATVARREGLKMLESIWFILWGVLWAVYFMLDGFDLGTGNPDAVSWPKTKPKNA